MKGVACFDCHVNGHTSAATHLVGDIRPQSHRRRIDTPSLRGVNIQRLFGSQRALKSSAIAVAASPPRSISSSLHQLGYDNLTLYDGSMGEWAKDPTLPIETD